MALRWQTIRVELVSGRGDTFDPPPGRILTIPPRTTFETLARAIDDAFARWDHSHLQQYVLPDGTIVSDEDTLSELGSGFDPRAPIPRTLAITTTLARRLKTGDRFTYVFDLGDHWTHLCTVEAPADPYEVYGAHVIDPTPFWGWGAIPDQYGRRWADDTGDPDDAPPHSDAAQFVVNPYGQTVASTAERPTGTELRIARGATPRELAGALVGKDLSEALQQVGVALLSVCAAIPKAPTTLETSLAETFQRLGGRGWAGDEILAETLLAILQRRPPEGLTATPVDVAEVADYVHDQFAERGLYVNVTTGEVWQDGLEREDDVDFDDNHWIHLSRDEKDYRDLAAFTDSVEDQRVRRELLDAIEGRGAFSRFRSVTERHGLVDRWLTFRDDRRIGRAREALADAGFRPRN